MLHGAHGADGNIAPSQRTMDIVDTLRIQETPEGVDMELRVAGPVVRAAALGIDTREPTVERSR